MADVLFGILPSLDAPVEPVNVLVPGVVGVPETVQLIEAPGATLAGGVGEQDVVRPAGSPLTVQLAPTAATSGDAPFAHVNVPE